MNGDTAMTVDYGRTCTITMIDGKPKSVWLRYSPHLVDLTVGECVSSLAVSTTCEQVASVLERAAALLRKVEP